VQQVPNIYKLLKKYFRIIYEYLEAGNIVLMRKEQYFTGNNRII
jgi:hypothetical protein